MPVDELPRFFMTALALGFVSAVLTIPLTKLCLEQGGYDWGVLARWFGGHDLVCLQPAWRFLICRSKNTIIMLKWLASRSCLCIRIFVMIYTVGWHPYPTKKSTFSSGRGS
jgi:hypothetical protein